MKQFFSRFNLKSYIAGALTVALLTPAVLFAANPTARETALRELTYGVNVIVNGRALELQGVDRPFILDGRTFLPVSVVAQSLGVPVQWDGATWTVNIGVENREPQRLFEVLSLEPRSNLALVTESFNSVTYTNSLHSPSGSDATGNIMLNGQYSTITGTLGIKDARRDAWRWNDGAGHVTVVFKGDGREIGMFTIRHNTGPIDIALNVIGVTNLSVEFTRHNGASTGSIALYNAMIQ